MANANFYFKFLTNATPPVGATSLTVTCDLYSVSRASGGITTIATGAACFEIGNGLYGYNISDPDFTTFDYVATAIPSSSSGLTNGDSDSFQGDLSYPSLKPATVGNTLTVDSGGNGNANVVNINGTPSAGTAGYVGIDWANVLNPTSTLALTGTTVKLVAGSFVTATLGTVLMPSNVTQILGTAVSTPATAGILDVNVKNISNAVVGTVAAQIGVNVVNFGGTTVTGRDIGESVLLSSGTGTGQIVLSSGQVQFSNTTIGTVTNLTNAPTAGDFTSTMKTSLNAATPASIQGAVASVTGNVGGSVVGSVGSIPDSPGTTKLVSTLVLVSGSTYQFTTQALANAPSGGGGGPTAAQIATAVWQDTISGDFTVSGSIGKSLFTSGAVPGGTGGIALVGSTMALTTAAITAIDTELSGAHGSGQWGSSSGSGAFTVTVTVTDTSSAAVPNANVRVTSGITSLVATTNGSGVATFALDAATWAIAITKPGYSFTPSAIAVTTSANFAETLTPVVIPAPPSGSNLCNVFGFFETLSGAANHGPIPITFALSVPSATATGGWVLIGTPISAVIAGGQLCAYFGGPNYVPLARNDSITPDSTTYLVTCAQVGLNATPLTLAATAYNLNGIVPP